MRVAMDAMENHADDFLPPSVLFCRLKYDKCGSNLSATLCVTMASHGVHGHPHGANMEKDVLLVNWSRRLF
jgi:hypothetical protein